MSTTQNAAMATDEQPPTVDEAARLRNTKEKDEVTVEDVMTQDGERLWVDTLLSCSEVEEEPGDYIPKIVCNDWKQAVCGWENTLPNVKYAWGEHSTSTKKRESDISHSKRTKAHRRQQTEEEDTWRRCVEPRSFRYVYDPKGLHHTTLKFYNGLTLERAVEEEGFSEHIMKLREFLEKTLTHAKKETSNGIKEHAKLGQYYANKSSPRRHKMGKHASGKKAKGKLRGIGDGLFVQNDVSEPEDEEDARVTFAGIEGKRLVDGLEHFKNERQATPILPMRKVDKFNYGQLNQRTTSAESPMLKLSHGLRSEHSPLSSYEKFPTQTVVPQELSLNPLKKVTPHQRQIHDDNEILSHAHISEKPSSAKSEPDHALSYKVVLERSSAPHNVSRTDRSSLVEVSGKAVAVPPPMKQFPLAQELAAVSKLLREQDQKNKNKGKRAKQMPQKLGGGYMSNYGEMGGSAKLGDPLHRGVMDRETAGAMASELLPGVSGHKLHLPTYSQRIL